MLEALMSTFKPDQFLIALLGHFANEATVKATASALKAIGLAVLGVTIEARPKIRKATSTTRRARRRSTPVRPKRGPKPAGKGRGREAAKRPSR